ncbi:hypothetical protein BH24BAC1_BH24BAC1_20830 [soil metagenome]
MRKIRNILRCRPPFDRPKSGAIGKGKKKAGTGRLKVFGEANLTYSSEEALVPYRFTFHCSIDFSIWLAKVLKESPSDLPSFSAFLL